MTGAEKIIQIIREQGKKEMGKGLQFAQMKSETVCSVGNLDIDREDYLKASHLQLKQGDTVVVYRVDEQTYLILEKVV